MQVHLIGYEILKSNATAKTGTRTNIDTDICTTTKDRNTTHHA